MSLFGFPVGSLRVQEGCCNFPQEPSLFQAEKPWLTQPVLVGEVLQPSDNVHGPPLDLLQQLHVLLALGAPKLEAKLKVGAHESRGAEFSNLETRLSCGTVSKCFAQVQVDDVSCYYFIHWD